MKFQGEPFLSRWAAAIIWTAGAAAFLAAGVRARSFPARLTGIVALVIGLVLAYSLYERGMLEEFLLFANLRFIACLIALLMTFAYGFVLQRYSDVCGEDERTGGKKLYWAAGSLLLLLLTMEAYTYCKVAVADPQRARWMALMSVSIVWGVCAAAALAVGFWKRIRPLRLAALGLFAVTAAKLVLVDVAGVKQIYRIIAFFVLGLLMMGAAYLYHKVEKRIEAVLGGEK